ERSRIQPVEEDRRARPVAGIAPVRVIAGASPHQRSSLREGIEQQLPMMVGQGRIVLGDRYKLDRDDRSPLMEQLEDGVLGIGADTAPRYRRRRTSDRLARGGDRFA